MQDVLPEIEKAGARLVAISPMIERYIPQLVNKLNLQFPVLADPGGRFLESLGVMFTLPDEMIEIYKGFGIDLERFNGNDEWRLPLPGRIVVDQLGTVRDVELSTDHTERPEPTASVALLKTMP